MSHRDRSEVLELTVQQCTTKAVRVSDAAGNAYWLPFSQIIEPDENFIRDAEGDTIEIEIPNWLAEEKGLL